MCMLRCVVWLPYELCNKHAHNAHMFMPNRNYRTLFLVWNGFIVFPCQQTAQQKLKEHMHNAYVRVRARGVLFPLIFNIFFFCLSLYS